MTPRASAEKDEERLQFRQMNSFMTFDRIALKSNNKIRTRTTALYYCSETDTSTYRQAVVNLRLACRMGWGLFGGSGASRD